MKLKFFCIIIVVAFMISGCSTIKPVKLSGKTMGTSWHIVIAEKEEGLHKNLQSLIELRLNDINGSMSIFKKGSELSHFNQTRKRGGKVCVSDDFVAVYKVARYLYTETGGAWDGTAGPLVNLWGFGNGNVEMAIPEQAKIKSALENVGFDKIRLVDGRCLVKENPDIILDLGSIAKGFGVDAISALLRQHDINNFLVEIGGEVYAAGTKYGKKWRVGVKTPELSLMSQKIFNTIELEDRAIATSGDYNNFREIDGVRYSHIINPETGWPVTNNVASVSVLAENTTLADGLATALMVMGVEKGIALVESLDDVECLIIERADEGMFTPHMSSGFQKDL